MKKLPRLLLKILITANLTLIPLTTPAQTVDGVKNCTEWLKNRKDGGIKAIGAQIWMSGFLSGINTVTFMTDKKDRLAKLNSMEEAFKWIDQYCSKNKTYHTDTAGLALMAELTQK